jgi:WD40 repeat protein
MGAKRRDTEPRDEVQPPGFTLRRPLVGHDWPVLAIEWSRDGKMIATGSADRSIRVWDAETGTPLQTLTGHSGVVFSVAWSPDSQWLASGSADHSVRFWKGPDWQPDWQDHEKAGSEVSCVAWSPDGAALASGSWDGEIRLSDLSGRTTRHLRRLHTAGVNSLAWRDKKLLCSGSKDGSIRFWDALTGNQERRPLEHDPSGDACRKGINSLAWSPDGKWFASGGDNGSVRLWKADNLTESIDFPDHAGPVTCVRFSPNSKLLASKAGHVRIWRCDTGLSVAILPEPRTDDWFRCLAFHHHKLRLATLGLEDKIVRIWDIDPEALSTSTASSRFDVRKGTGDFDVFLSYNTDDQPEVFKIAKQLKEEGIRPWLDEDELDPGDDILEELETLFTGGKVKSAAVLMGKTTGPWQNEEIKAFVRKMLKEKFLVIPVILASNGKTAPQPPYFLDGKKHVDLRKPGSDEFARLVRRIVQQGTTLRKKALSTSPAD